MNRPIEIGIIIKETSIIGIVANAIWPFKAVIGTATNL